jgi:hypothetical protein
VNMLCVACGVLSPLLPGFHLKLAYNMSGVLPNAEYQVGGSSLAQTLCLATTVV